MDNHPRDLEKKLGAVTFVGGETIPPADVAQVAATLPLLRSLGTQIRNPHLRLTPCRKCLGPILQTHVRSRGSLGEPQANGYALRRLNHSSSVPKPFHQRSDRYERNEITCRRRRSVPKGNGFGRPRQRPTVLASFSRSEKTMSQLHLAQRRWRPISGSPINRAEFPVCTSMG